MAVADLLFSPWTPVVALLLYYVVPYFTTYSALQGIPGPFFAKFTNLWLLAQARQGFRYKSVDDAHKKHGKLVRIQPDHVSVADADAVQAIYGVFYLLWIICVKRMHVTIVGFIVKPS